MATAIESEKSLLQYLIGSTDSHNPIPYITEMGDTVVGVLIRKRHVAGRIHAQSAQSAMLLIADMIEAMEMSRKERREIATCIRKIQISPPIIIGEIEGFIAYFPDVPFVQTAPKDSE